VPGNNSNLKTEGAQSFRSPECHILVTELDDNHSCLINYLSSATGIDALIVSVSCGLILHLCRLPNVCINSESYMT
jgi:hypothetical protein